jgi:Tfp pilus assembly protein PilP
VATAQSKILVAGGGVKGVRIGMDGKTPPTTSVVVDLEQAFNYDLTPGAGNTLLLTLHTSQSSAKSGAAAPAVAKSSTPSAKPQTIAKSATPTAVKPSAPAPKPGTVASKLVFGPPASLKVANAAKSPASPAITAKGAPQPTTKIAAAPEPSKNEIKKVEAPKPPKPEEKKWAMTGKRDPFFSPVVQQSAGSGCSTGKKCLEIGQINVRGVVKSETGFIAVVTNSLNKAYFLHENDPVFNGFVVKITGDSVVFQETFQDKLGKPFTREIVKRILTPAV